MIQSLIDHTILKPGATRDDVRRLCSEAREHGFFSVCLNPYWVALAANELSGSAVKVCTVAGFPLGASTAFIKNAEADEALRHGAVEIDMVINVGALRAGDTAIVLEEIGQLAHTCHRSSALLKVIIETALLTDDQKRLACELSVRAGADFVKTSTGFAAHGATVEDVALMRAVVGPNIGVKASGGIRTLADLRRMVEAGANRIGASSGVDIMRELAASS